MVKDKETLSASEKALLKALLELKEKGEEQCTPRHVLNTNVGHEWKGRTEVMNSASWLKTKGLVKLREDIETYVTLDKEGKKYARDGLPEKELASLIEGGETGIKDIISNGSMAKGSMNIAMANLRPLGLKVIKGNLELEDEGRAKKGIRAREKALSYLEEKKEVPIGEMDREVLENLKGRSKVIKTRERTQRIISLTDKGEKIGGGIEDIEEETGQLTPRIIQSGDWKKGMRPYDINTFAPRTLAARTHPLSDLTDQIKEVFLSMGFEEIGGKYVRSAFWNMDVLFIPQDHPARDLQDTLYVENPGEIEPEREYLPKIKAVHENGGDTGSKGWEYQWDEAKARKALLRTHTTVETIRKVAERKQPPVKVFSVDRVFRNEAIDSTHLPEFHQIEGIIMEKNASFSLLIGILKEFYNKIGFPDIRVRPAYFPYTEPSLEVEAMFKGSWMELGGAGIFRPEVTAPFGVEYPVLAWGLGLERLALALYDLNDIRDLYMSDLDWLRGREMHFLG